MKKIIISLLLLLCTNSVFAIGPGPGTGPVQPIDKDVWFLVLFFVVSAVGFIIKKSKTKTI
jgi:hypothetical protein